MEQLLPLALPFLAAGGSPGILLVPWGRDPGGILRAHQCVGHRDVIDLRPLSTRPFTVLTITPTRARGPRGVI